jgi:hypothetical protein
MAIVFKLTQEGQAEKIIKPARNNQIRVRTRETAATNNLTVQYRYGIQGLTNESTHSL